ncbi:MULTISPECIES: tripartite tricarboxylate transporter TctB family protein [unclassified Pyramidobacter]|uniref:tripartite tricarboxylate transporter TctB family protein n=1 Tax=unclassified Pyramidobacter TaxID=2632171 RepID=UPI000EA3A584|nr:tripartite tricarboxylate transporter TctB family protein [Pyramidobacter sp. CG50-2]RKJ78999.1 tripartite tricarboxylate transporter TctB family protein [Pyramidobacter sp. CG50-2]
MKRHQDVTIGIVILLFCAFFTCCALRMDMGPALMPLILLAFMAVLGLIILADGIRKTRRATAENPVRPFVTCATLKTPLTMFALIVVYVLLFLAVGYYAATILFLMAAMRFLKQKSWLFIAVTTAGFVAFAYFFLVRQLNVSIDELGWLGNWLRMRGGF